MAVGFAVELWLAAAALRWLVAADGMERIAVSESGDRFRIGWNATEGFRFGNALFDGFGCGGRDGKVDNLHYGNGFREIGSSHEAVSSTGRRGSDIEAKSGSLAARCLPANLADHNQPFSSIFCPEHYPNNLPSPSPTSNPQKPQPKAQPLRHHSTQTPKASTPLRVRVRRRSCPFNIDCIHRPHPQHRRLQQIDQFAVKREVRLSAAEIPSVATATLAAVFRWRCSPPSRPS